MKKVLFSLLSLSFALQLISQLDAYASNVKIPPVRNKPFIPIVKPDPPSDPVRRIPELPRKPEPPIIKPKPPSNSDPIKRIY